MSKQLTKESPAQQDWNTAPVSYWSVTIAMFLMYIVLFFVLVGSWKREVTVLAFFPIVTAALLLGWRVGLIFTAMSFSFTVLAFEHYGLHGFEYAFQGFGLIRLVVLTAICVAIGKFSDIQRTLRRYLQERETHMHTIMRLASVVESTGEVVEMMDVAGRYIYVNPSFETILGFSSSEALGQTSMSLLGDDLHDAREYASIFESVWAQGHWRGELRHRCKDGTIRTFFTTLSAHCNGNKSARSLIAVKLDITEEKEQSMLEQKRQKMQIDRLAMALEQAGDAIELVSPKIKLEYVNPSWERMMGYSREESLGVSPIDLLIEDSEQEAKFNQDIIDAVWRGRSWRGEIVHRRKDGQYIVVDTTLSAVMNEEGRVVQFVALKRDITEQKLQEDELWYQAFHDALTSLPNRALLMTRLQHSIARMHRIEERSFSLLFMDLDGFKEVNDTLGHHMGDQLLVEVAERLTCIMREVDTVARLGGDEFVVLIDDTASANDAVRAAERVLEAIHQPFSLANKNIFVSVSIGIVLGTTKYVDPEAVLIDADSAMYRAKQQGKAQYILFDEDMHSQAIERLYLQEELKQAAECDLLQLQYQPVVRLHDRHVMKLEVQLDLSDYWDVGQGSILEQIEDVDILMDVCKWIIRRAIGQSMTWKDSLILQCEPFLLLQFPVSVYMHEHFPEYICSVLCDANVHPSQVQLNLAESSIHSLRVMERLEPHLYHLHSLGFHLGFHYTGVGCMPLAHLAELPFRTIKIGSSLTMYLTQDEVPHGDASHVRKKAALYSVIAFAQHADLELIVVGVHTEELYERLCDLEVGFGQGFYLSPLLSAEEVERQMHRTELKTDAVVSA